MQCSYYMNYALIISTVILNEISMEAQLTPAFTIILIRNRPLFERPNTAPPALARRLYTVHPLTPRALRLSDLPLSCHGH